MARFKEPPGFVLQLAGGAKEAGRPDRRLVFPITVPFISNSGLTLRSLRLSPLPLASGKTLK